ncbi:MAG TPA: hypothetical protein VNL34_04645 [Candidatus Nitrosotenuis sp.]|nr:hypothetical protein [Candidatus Nitrosotenuis sp.]
MTYNDYLIGKNLRKLVEPSKNKEKNLGDGSGHGMSGGMGHSAPGAVQQMCHPAGDMPPHYCEPTYHTMSSVRGIRIGTVDAANDNEVVVSLKQIGKSAPPVSKKLVIVGGSGNLAGATIIDSGWSKSMTVHLRLDGFGTIYDYGAMHIHVFPYTGE